RVRGHVVVEGEGDPAVYLPYLFEAEVEVCRRLQVLLERPAPAAPPGGSGERTGSWEAEIALAEARSGLKLSDEQREALRQALARAIAAWCQARQQRLVLASPTGRAARRLQEATGLPARTIHRTLEFTYVPGVGGRFLRNGSNPLEADVVLVDELSMVDLPLFA